MKHKIFLLLFFCLYYLSSKSQNLFVADYAITGFSDNKSLVCYDHTFFRAHEITAGQINVMKTDSVGNVLWSNDLIYFPNANFFELTNIVQAADSGFLILLNWWGNAASNHSDPTVTKIDKNGNPEWTRTYISVLSAYGNGIIKNNDNGFMVVGSRQLVDFVMKCDSTGTITWIKQFNATSPANNYNIATQDYNRFVVTGSHGHAITFFQTDLSGNLYWHKAITFGQASGATWSLKPLRNGGYISMGCSNYTANFSYDGILLKTDSTGATQWLKIYQANQGSPGDVTELPDSSLLMVGKAMSGGLALKTDKNGTFQFAKTETVLGSYSCVNQFSPGTVLLSGYLTHPFIALTDTACSTLCNTAPFAIQEYTPAFTDTVLNFIPATLPFIDDTAQITFVSHPLQKNVLCGFTSVNENAAQDQINIYPDPATDKLTVQVNNNEPSEVILYNIVSEKILREKFTNSIIVNTTSLAKGIYLYQVKNKNGVIKKGKVVKD